MPLVPLNNEITREAVAQLLGLDSSQQVLAVRPTGYLVQVKTTEENQASITWREVKITGGL